jgi:hypothetical protein
MGYLQPLTGDEPIEEIRQFFIDYVLMAKTAMWTDEEMCQNLFRFVRKPVSTFIRQLGKRARTWRTLEADLKAEYLRSDESPMERYCSLAQDRVESARHFLWRLNAAAERANLEVRGGDGLERHVTRFTRALRDPVLKSKMSSVVVRSLGDLDKMLALHEVRVGKDREDAPAKERERGMSRDRDRDYDRDRRDRERDRSVSRAKSASTYWAYQEDYGGNNYARSVSDFTSRSDAPTERTVRFEEDEDFLETLSEEGSHAYKATGSTTPAPGRFAGGGARWQPNGQAASPRYRPSNVNRPVAAPHPGPASLAGTQSPRGGAPNDQFNDTRRGSCHNCGEYGHWAAECPQPRPAQPVCGHCKGPHPPESCWKKCPACSHVHAKPEDCAVVRAIEELKSWYKTTASAGGNPALPPSLLQQLDKPLN